VNRKIALSIGLVAGQNRIHAATNLVYSSRGANTHLLIHIICG